MMRLLDGTWEGRTGFSTLITGAAVKPAMMAAALIDGTVDW